MNYKPHVVVIGTLKSLVYFKVGGGMPANSETLVWFNIAVQINSQAIVRSYASNILTRN